MRLFVLVIVSLCLCEYFHSPSYANTPLDFNALVNTIIQAESSGNPNAVGDSGKARGLMQLQECTWKEHTKEPFSKAFNPSLNRQVGSLRLRKIINKYQERATPALVVYTYNTGRFVKPGCNIPAWTKKHPNKIYRNIFNEKYSI